MKNNSYIFLFFIISILFISGVTLASFSGAPSDQPSYSTYDGYSVPSNNPTPFVFDVSATTQYKSAGLSVSPIAVGKTGYVSVDTSGRLGVNTGTPYTGVRVFVNGSISSSSVSGTGISKICTGSTNGSSTDGYPLVRC